MKEHTFTDWLGREITSAQCMLLTTYEERDKVKFIEAPALEAEYMDKVGMFEQEVIEAELECELLQEKKNMVQACINRREVVNEEEIDAKIDERRNALKAQLSMNMTEGDWEEIRDRIANQLKPEEQSRLQKLYHEIVEKYHPATNPDQPEAFNELFKRAQEAYRMKNLPELELISEMFKSTETGGLQLQVVMEMLDMELEEKEETVLEKLKELGVGTDYKLAGELYSSFQPFQEEIPVYEALKRYRKLINEVMEEINKARGEFPFIAKEMLADPDKVNDYKADLEYRLCHAKEDQERRQKEIRQMIDESKGKGVMKDE